jgi:dTDP-4-dehydrorhamnose reductase
MRILVTGITGQVGSALCVALAAIGDVLPLDRRQLDLSRPDEISDGLDKFRPELIVNPAAYTAVDRAEDEPDLAYRVNGEAPKQIAIWAAARDVPLVHFSTDYVFDGSGERPWREDDATHPLSVYGASKLAGESAIRAARAPHLIVRTSWVYAATGTNFLRTIARLAREREDLRIVNDQVGTPTPARMLAHTVTTILKHCGAGISERFTNAGGIVNIAASGQATWFDFATAIVDGLRARDISLKVKAITPVKTEDYPTKAKRPKNSRFDLAQLAQQFAIVPPHWKEGLAVELDALALEMKEGQRQ